MRKIIMKLCFCLTLIITSMPILAQEQVQENMSINNATAENYLSASDSALKDTPKGTLDFSTTAAKASFVIFLLLLGVGYYFLRRPPRELRYSKKKSAYKIKKK